MASDAFLIVMYGVTVWNPSGTGSTSPLICPLSKLTSSSALRVYALIAWFPSSHTAVQTVILTTSSWLGGLRGSRGRWYGALIEREPERVCEFRGSRPADQHFRRLMPAGAIAQSTGETGDEVVVDRCVRFEVDRLDLEGSLLAVGFGVEPANEGAVVEYREGVVSVPAAGSGSVDLDLVLEVEELESPRPIPDHRVEGG